MHGPPTRHNWSKPRDQKSQPEHIDKALLVTLARLSVANLEPNATPMERIQGSFHSGRDIAAPLKRRLCS